MGPDPPGTGGVESESWGGAPPLWGSCAPPSSAPSRPSSQNYSRAEIRCPAVWPALSSRLPDARL